jgi:hypothetical protein
LRTLYSFNSNAFRFLFTCESLQFDVGPVEPLFGVAALYDAHNKVRMSEFFYFDFNGDNTSQLYNFENDSLRSALRSAMFAVTNPVPNLILVVRVERLMRGDVESDMPLYGGKGKDVAVLRSAFVQETRKLSSRSGLRLQPLAWGAAELFGSRGW